MNILIQFTLTGLFFTPVVNPSPPDPNTSSVKRITAHHTSEVKQTINPSRSEENVQKYTHDYVRGKIQETLKRLTHKRPTMKVSWRDEQLNPSLILKMNLETQGDTPQRQAESFISHYKDLWPQMTIRVIKIKESRGRATAHLRAYIKELEILNQDAKLSLNTLASHNTVLNLSNGISALTQIHYAQVTREQAEKTALDHVGFSQQTTVLTRRGLVTLAQEAVEVFEVELSPAPLKAHWVIRVNGVDGSIMSVTDRVRR